MPGPDAKAEAERLCVFTTLMGRYEELNEQPVAARSSIPFICLTDDPELRSDTWQIRLVAPFFKMDPTRSQRDVKIRPHLHLTGFDASIYIDNSVLLAEPPEALLERYSTAAGFCLPRHSHRESVLDEFLEVARLGFDDQNRIFEQLSHYAIDYPDLLGERPYWTGIMLRDHRNPTVRATLEIWAAHVHRYSRRDQLSINVALRQGGLQPDVMDIDNHASWFHSWPHAHSRERASKTGGRLVSFGPPAAYARGLEQELAEQVRRHEAILASPSWRIASFLSERARRHPYLAGLVRRVLG